MGQMGWYLFRTDVPGIVVARVSCFFLFSFLLQVRVFVCVAHCSRNILEVVLLFVIFKQFFILLFLLQEALPKKWLFARKLYFFRVGHIFKRVRKASIKGSSYKYQGEIYGTANTGRVANFLEVLY